jgi:hypothetical protein
MTTHENDAIENERLTRRGSLLRLVGLAAAAGGAGALRLETADAAGPLAVSPGLVTCVLTPELTEGPYYVAGEKLRRDVTEGKPGTSLRLNLTVVNASTCKPVKNAAVEIWHCDAGGVYSGAVAHNPGTNFLRGVQKTNAAVSRRSRRSIPASTRAARCTSTSRCTSAARSFTPGSCSSRPT